VKMLFWILTPCKLVGRCQRFEKKTYCLHLQGWSDSTRHQNPEQHHQPQSASFRQRDSPRFILHKTKGKIIPVNESYNLRPRVTFSFSLP
jgi:hypothetical protein